MNVNDRSACTAAFLLMVLPFLLAAPAFGDRLEFVEQQRRFDPVGVASSPDGVHVYAVANAGGGIAVYRRDLSNGALTLTEVQRQGVAGEGANGLSSLTISPDGQNIYVGARRIGLAVLRRDAATGALTPVQTMGVGDDTAARLDGTQSIALSPDGRHVYTASYYGGAIGVFRRAADTGALTFVEFQINGVNGVSCGLQLMHAVAVSPDGAHVYATGSDCRGGTTVVFHRDPDTGQLALLGAVRDRDLSAEQVAQLRSFADAASVIVSADGLNVYVAVPRAGVGVFRRDALTGFLSLVQVIPGRRSIDVPRGLHALALSADGLHLYGAADVENAVSLFARDPATGMLSMVDARFAGVDGFDGLRGASALALSPDGASAYVAGTDDNAIAVVSRNADTGKLRFIEANRSAAGGIMGLHEPRSVAMSEDGHNAYVVSRFDSAIEVFDRDTTTGGLTFAQALFNDADGIEGLVRPEAVAVSPDGHHVYAAGSGADAIVAFQRDPVSGRLSFVAAEIEPSTGSADANNPTALAVSPDGKHVYVANEASATIAVYRRDATAGTLSLVEVLREGMNGVHGLHLVRSVVVSPDGLQVYAAGFNDNAVVTFSRNTVSGKLTFIAALVDGEGGVAGLNYPFQAAVSPDGRNVYVACAQNGGADNPPHGSVVTFARNAMSGALTFMQALTDGVDGVDGLNTAAGVAVSPDGQFVYVASLNDSAVAMFRRDPGSGALSFVHAVFEGVDADGLGAAWKLAVSPDSRHVYAVAVSDDAVAVFAVDPSAPAPTPAATQTATAPAFEAGATATQSPTCTATASIAATSTPTIVDDPRPTPTTPSIAAASPTVSIPPASVAVRCHGDCDSDGRVTIGEVIEGVAMVLGTLPSAGCAALDSNADGAVTVDELLVAVNMALAGCP